MRFQYRVLKIAISILGSATWLACNVNPADLGPAVIQQASLSVEARLNQKLEASLTPIERKTLKADIKALFRYNIVASSNGPFAQVFGGRYSSSVARFLDERIQLIVSSGVRSKHQYNVIQFENVFKDSWLRRPDYVDGMMAGSFASGFWYQAMRSRGPLYIGYHLAEGQLAGQAQRMQIIPGKTQVMQLGYWYGNDSNQSTSISRIGVLIHEARHSDCPEPLTEADRKSIRDGGEPLNPTCSQNHAICPKKIKLPDGTTEDHPLAGDDTCENIPWGPYSLSAIYLGAMAAECKNCTELEKQEALLSFTGELPHLLIPLEDLIAGKHGKPKLKTPELKL